MYVYMYTHAYMYDVAKTCTSIMQRSALGVRLLHACGISCLETP